MECCSISGCGRPVHARGWCGRHYQRWYTTGDPEGAYGRLPTAEERFWAKVNRDGPVPTFAPDLGPCWLWTPISRRDGYGAISVDGSKVLAHRFSWELHVGPIPPGLEIDHLCRVRACVRPSHLEAVTQQINIERGACGVLKTHCIQGHAFTPENTYVVPRTGARQCRACKVARAAPV